MILDIAARFGNAAAAHACIGAAALHGLGASSSPPLSLEALKSLDQNGFAVCENWLTAHELFSLQQDMRLRQPTARVAGVGTTRAGTRRMDTRVRRSRTYPLDAATIIGNRFASAQLHTVHRIHMLCAELNAARLPGIAQLDAPSMELGYVFYERGGFYGRHLDVPRTLAAKAETLASGGGAEAGNRREISILLYTNGAWENAWGGQLRLHPAVSRGSRCRTSPVDILPHGGTLVLMRSACMVHEVLPTTRERMCLVGWLRSNYNTCL